MSMLNDIGFRNFVAMAADLGNGPGSGKGSKKKAETGTEDKTSGSSSEKRRHFPESNLNF